MVIGSKDSDNRVVRLLPAHQEYTSESPRFLPIVPRFVRGGLDFSVMGVV